MSTAVLMLPFPPSENRIWRSIGGRNIKSKAYRDWELLAGQALVAQQKNWIWFHDPVSVTFTFGRPDKRKRDLLNYVKTIPDLLQKFNILDDDSLIHEAHVRWDDTVRGCMCEITPLLVAS